MRLFHTILIFLSLGGLSYGKSRQKRWLWFNGYAPMILGIVVGTPFSAYLPGLGPQGRALTTMNSIADSEDFQGDLTIQPQYQEELEKISTAFAALGVSALVCQELLICQMAASPETFSPVSDIILREVKKGNGPIIKSEKSLMWRYARAAKVGLISIEEECHKAYPKCSVASHRILNKSSLKLFQFLSKMTNVKVH